jgi:hypothetical protein
MRFGNVFNSKKQCKSVFTSLFVRVCVVTVIFLSCISQPALAKSGKIVGWGIQVISGDLSKGFVKVASGGEHSLGLKNDGSIVAWGSNSWGQCNIPSPNTGFIAISAGYLHSLGLRQDSSIVAWGSNDSWQCNIPSPNSGFIAISAGYKHSLGLKKV